MNICADSKGISKGHSPAPKTGQTIYCCLLKSVEVKCNQLNCLLLALCPLLILIDRLCFGRYKIDQHRERSDRFPNRILSNHLTRNQSG